MEDGLHRLPFDLGRDVLACVDLPIQNCERDADRRKGWVVPGADLSDPAVVGEDAGAMRPSECFGHFDRT